MTKNPIFVFFVFKFRKFLTCSLVKGYGLKVKELRTAILRKICVSRMP